MRRGRRRSCGGSKARPYDSWTEIRRQKYFNNFGARNIVPSTIVTYLLAFFLSLVFCFLIKKMQRCCFTKISNPFR